MMVWFLSLFAFLFLTIGIAGAEESKPVTYEDDVRPILRQYCFKCHGEDEQEAGINLATFGALLKGGSAGKIVTAGRASSSLLFDAITREDPDARMPPNSPPLPAEKIETIRQWIQNGLLEKSGSTSLAATRDLSFNPATASMGKPEGPPPMPRRLPKVKLPEFVRPLPIISLAASPWAPLLAASGQDHVQLVDLESQEQIGLLPFPEGEPHVLRFSRDGQLLMVAGGRPVQNGKIVLYDVRSGKRLADYGDEIDAILAADLSPDQTQVALGGSGGVVKVYSTTDGSLLYKLDKHTDWITALAFSPDGTKLVTADRAGGVYLWDAKSGGILLTLAEHKASVNAVAWRSDSRMIATGGEDGLIVWWDASDGWPAFSKSGAHQPPRAPGQYGKLPNGVLSLSFAPDGKLVSCGRDNVARLWNPNGGELSKLKLAEALPTKVAAAADGKTFIVGDAHGAIHYWSPEK